MLVTFGFSSSWQLCDNKRSQECCFMQNIKIGHCHCLFFFFLFLGFDVSCPTLVLNLQSLLKRIVCSVKLGMCSFFPTTWKMYFFVLLCSLLYHHNNCLGKNQDENNGVYTQGTTITCHSLTARSLLLPMKTKQRTHLQDHHAWHSSNLSMSCFSDIFLFQQNAWTDIDHVVFSVEDKTWITLWGCVFNEGHQTMRYLRRNDK